MSGKFPIATKELALDLANHEIVGKKSGSKQLQTIIAGAKIEQIDQRSKSSMHKPGDPKTSINAWRCKFSSWHFVKAVLDTKFLVWLCDPSPSQRCPERDRPLPGTGSYHGRSTESDGFISQHNSNITVGFMTISTITINYFDF